MEYVMKYNFDEAVERRGTGCLKYDFAKERGKKEDVLPLWVADMDFKTAPAVTERLQKVVEHGIYGYSDSKEDYFAAVSGWYHDHFDWEAFRMDGKTGVAGKNAGSCFCTCGRCACIYGKRRYSFDPTAGILSVSSGH